MGLQAETKTLERVVERGVAAKQLRERLEAIKPSFDTYAKNIANEFEHDLLVLFPLYDAVEALATEALRGNEAVQNQLNTHLSELIEGKDNEYLFPVLRHRAQLDDTEVHNTNPIEQSYRAFMHDAFKSSFEGVKMEMGMHEAEVFNAEETLEGVQLHLAKLREGTQRVLNAFRGESSLEPVSLAKALEKSVYAEVRAAQSMQGTQQAPSYNVTVEVDTQAPYVMADPVGLEGVFRNLVSNALKAINAQNGAENKLNVSHTYNPETNTSLATVADTGIGMDVDFMKNDLFGHGKGQFGKYGQPSEGVGLSGAKAYWDSIGGEVRVESVKNEGTTFYLKLQH